MPSAMYQKRDVTVETGDGRGSWFVCGWGKDMILVGNSLV